MLRHLKQLKKHFSAEEGATVVEYAVLVALVIAVCIAIIFILGGRIEGAFQMFLDRLSTTSGS